MSMASWSGNLPAPCRPVAVAAGDRIDVFAIDRGGAVQHWTSSGGAWSPLPPLPAPGPVPQSYPCAIALGNGTQYVFVITGTADIVYWSGSGTNWAAHPKLFAPPPLQPSSFPAGPAGLAAASWDDSRIDVFGIAAGGPFHGGPLVHWVLDGAGNLRSAEIVPGSAQQLPTSVLAAVATGPGQVEVFAAGPDGHPWRWSCNGATWSGPQSLAGPPIHAGNNGFAALSQRQGSVDLFAIAGDGSLCHWSSDTGFGAEVLPGPGHLPDGVPAAVLVGADRHIEVFAIGPGPLLRWQRSGTTWSGPVPLGGQLAAGGVSAVARGAQVDAFAISQADASLQHWPRPFTERHVRLFHPECEGFAFHNNWFLTQEETAALGGILNSAIPGVMGLLAPVLGPLLGPAYPLVVPAALAASIAIAIKNWNYGLCGGMAYAALDYWQQGWVVQRGFESDPPTKPCPEAQALRSFIWRRLLDSFATGGVLPRTLEWMTIRTLTPGGPGNGEPQLRRMTVPEWNQLRQHLDAGQPRPIALIRAVDNPSENHQVLAYGYEQTSDDRITILVYDNNRPSTEQTIDLTFSNDELVQLRESATGGTPALCGFFCSAYAPVVPPVAIGLSTGISARPDQAHGVNAPISFDFVVKNYGYGPSPPVAPGVLAQDLTGLLITPIHAAAHATSGGDQALAPIGSPVAADGAPSAGAGDLCRPVTDPEVRPPRAGTWRVSPEVRLQTSSGQILYKRVPAGAANQADHLDLMIR